MEHPDPLNILEITLAELDSLPTSTLQDRLDAIYEAIIAERKQRFSPKGTPTWQKALSNIQTLRSVARSNQSQFALFVLDQTASALTVLTSPQVFLDFEPDLPSPTETTVDQPSESATMSEQLNTLSTLLADISSQLRQFLSKSDSSSSTRPSTDTALPSYFSPESPPLPPTDRLLPQERDALELADLVLRAQRKAAAISASTTSSSTSDLLHRAFCPACDGPARDDCHCRD